MSEHFNKIAKHLDTLSRRHDLSKIFNDFLTLGICAYHTTNLKSRFKDKDPENEKLYFSVLDKYNKEEIKYFPEMLSELHLHLDKNPYTDPLGEYYMLNISNGKNGQYFTPQPICTLMAKLQGRDPIENKRISDPACGSGRTLLAIAQIHPQNAFFGNDNNNTCVKMATLNLFLHNLTAEINWMNTLSGEWYGGWHINAENFGIQPIEKEQSLEWENANTFQKEQPPFETEKKKTNIKPLSLDQLNLFDP